MLHRVVLFVSLLAHVGATDTPGMFASVQLGDLDTGTVTNSKTALLQAIGSSIAVEDSSLHVVSLESSTDAGLPAVKVNFRADLSCDMVNAETIIAALPGRLNDAIQQGTLWQKLRDNNLAVSWVELDGTPTLKSCMPFIQLSEPNHITSEVADHVECSYNGHHVKVHHKKKDDDRSFFCKRASKVHNKYSGDECVCKVWKTAVPVVVVPTVAATPMPTFTPTSSPTQGAVDCVEDEWSEWTKCSKTCGGGSQYQSREVLIYPAFGGKDCPALLDVRQCNTGPCTHPTAAPTQSPTFPTKSPTVRPTMDDWWNMDEDPMGENFGPGGGPGADDGVGLGMPTPAPQDMYPIGAAPTGNPTPIPPTPSPTAPTTASPTASPTAVTTSPTEAPTLMPTVEITLEPTASPSSVPTTVPTAFEAYQEFENEVLHPPSPMPTKQLTPSPTTAPTQTAAPTLAPTSYPTPSPTFYPTKFPTSFPTLAPTKFPTHAPSHGPTTSPTFAPTSAVTQICACTGSQPCQHDDGISCFAADPATNTCPATTTMCSCPCSGGSPCAGTGTTNAGSCFATNDLYGAAVCPASSVHCPASTPAPTPMPECSCGHSKPCQHIGGLTCFAAGSGEVCPVGTRRCNCNCAAAMPCKTADSQCAPAHDLYGVQVCPAGALKCAAEE